MAYLAVGKYNDTQSIYDRRNAPIGLFYPDRTPPQPNRPPGEFTSVEWDSSDSSDVTMFMIDPAVKSFLVCLKDGIYHIRATVTRLSTALDALSYIESAVVKNPGPSEVVLGWDQHIEIVSNTVGAPKSTAIGVFAILHAGDVLLYRDGPSQASSIAGLPQGHSSQFTVRRIGGVPGPG